MVTITRVAKFQSTLVEELEELGGDVTHTDTDWDYYDNECRPVYWKVEVYFEDEQYDADLEQALDGLTKGTGWSWGSWDPDANGVLFERDLRD